MPRPIPPGASTVALGTNNGNLPNMSETIGPWYQTMTFTTIVKTIVNFQVVETPTNVVFNGTWQPFTLQQLLMKPEGQRQWPWYQVHAEPSLVLIPDEVITYQGTQFRVMSKFDYLIYGYNQYDLVQDFTGSGPA